LGFNPNLSGLPVLLPVGVTRSGREKEATMRRAVLAVVGTSSIALLSLFSAAPAYATVTVSVFGTPSANSAPEGITLGPNGDLYFSEEAADNIGELTPSSGIPTFGTEVPLPSGDAPDAMVTGRDGNLWFIDTGTDEIGRITTAGTGLQEFSTGEAGGIPFDITPGPDGNLWFTMEAPQLPGSSTYVGYIGRIPVSGSPVKDFQITPPAACSSQSSVDPFGITTGSNGNLWFTAETCLGGTIGEITTSGTTSMFPIDDPASNPVSITAGPGGNLWFPGNNEPDVEEMNTSGTVVGWFMTPSLASRPVTIADDGCAGDLWMTDDGTGTADRVTSSGTITTYPVSSGLSGYIGPHSITGDQFGMWFTDTAAGDIDRLVDTSGYNLCVTLIPTGKWVQPSMRIPMGGQIGWLMADPQGTHGVADASGLDLFGYGATGGPTSYLYGTNPSFTFDWAGAFPYDDPFHPSAKGTVSVPPTAAKIAGTTDEANVTWAVGDAPSGDAFDVQVEVPGSSQFVDWQTAVTSLSSPFGPSDPLWAGPGKYEFRAGVIQPSTGAATGYSPAVSISL
jgi:virginiamycin B lyase